MEAKGSCPTERELLDIGRLCYLDYCGCQLLCDSILTCLRLTQSEMLLDLVENLFSPLRFGSALGGRCHGVAKTV